MRTDDAQGAMHRVQVTAVVVSYNTRGMTLICLESLFAQTAASAFEVIVIDNASSDGSADAIEEQFGDQVTLIRSEQNVGFAGANNIAIKHATGRRVLLLNPDTLVLDRAIERLLAFADTNPNARVWGGRTVFEDGRPNPASCWNRQSVWSLLCKATGASAVFGTSRVFNPEQPDAWSSGRPAHVDIVSGCFLLIDTDLWHALGGFDPSFFMYGEEADLCLRAAKLGARPMVCDEAVIVHHGGASESVRYTKMIRLLDARRRLCARHWKHPWLAGPLTALWPLSRLFALSLIAIVRPAARTRRDEWRRIWKHRSRWLKGDGGRDAAEGLA